MIRKSLITLIIAGLIPMSAMAHDEHEKKVDIKQVQITVQNILNNIITDNSGFVKSHDANYFSPFQNGQTPRATVIECADSRVHDQALDNTPDSDLFIIREIGNQITTAPGSVDYGVNHLHTPLLLIVGHVGCGAVTAALNDYSKLEPDVVKELDGLKLTKGESVAEGVKENVNNQVAAAKLRYQEKVKAGALVVVGAIYDFKNEYGQGYGKLVIININGETDIAKINKSSLLAVK